MKLQTQERLQLSFAEFLRATFGSPWFWECLPCASETVRRNQRKLQRAAKRCKGNPLLIYKSIGGPDRFAPDINLPEVAAVAQCSLWDLLAAVAQQGLRERPADDRIRLVLFAFLGSLAAKPVGRKGLPKYRKAADLLLNKMRMHQICVQLEPGYSSMSVSERLMARNRMRSGINRAKRRTKFTH
jgi:hypothetical protein